MNFLQENILNFPFFEMRKQNTNRSKFSEGCRRLRFMGEADKEEEVDCEKDGKEETRKKERQSGRSADL